jgi:hypothetical protein
LYLIVIASFFALVVGGGYQTEGNAQVQSTSKESEQQTITVPYEAMLTDKSGNPVDDGLYDFTFTLYGSETDTHLLWSEVQEGIDVQGGRVFTNLGAMRPFPQSLNKDGGTLWLEVGVRGPGEVVFTVLEPRQHLSTSIQTTQSSSTAEDVCAHDHLGETWDGTEQGLTVYSNSFGVAGWSENSTGLIGISGILYIPPSTDFKHGVFGSSLTSHGIVGKTLGEWSWISGVYGEASKVGANGVTGWNTADGVGVYGYSETGYAGYFNGPVTVTGFLTKSGGGFKIDHPLDPANKYLNHSFVESPDMKNIYDGVVNLDADGAAWVELPEWFEALNKDFRYQLTPIGAPGSNLYIAQEIENKRFRIAGGDPGLKVSWQVTGSRHDAFAEEHPIVVEEEKPLEEQGTYLHPEEQGKPQTEGLDYQRNQPPEQFETGGE